MCIRDSKVIVFTAFADTAHYLYEQLRPLVVDELGLGMAEVTGAAGSKTTVDGCLLYTSSLPLDWGAVLGACAV